MADETPRRGSDGAPSLRPEDAFWLTDLYPEAKALFEHEQASLDEVSVDCVVVLDANVLLWPYEFNSASMKEVEKVYEHLAQEQRLVVPGQAAREFYKHRSRKIAAVTDVIEGAITKAKAQIFERNIPLLEEDEDYQAARELAKENVNRAKEIIAHLTRVNERLKDEIGTDRVSDSYRRLLTHCVVDIPCKTEIERKELISETARRARLQIAPGFKDQSKEDGGIGDYVIWRTILQVGKQRKVHCIFVTNEEKSDWWIKTRGAFQPRPELLEEYRRETEGRSIHLLPLSGLLANFKAEEAVVQEVQSLEEAKRARVTMSDLDAQYSQLLRDQSVMETELNGLQGRYRDLVTALATTDARRLEIEGEINGDQLPGRRAELIAEFGSINAEQRGLVEQVQSTLRMIDERRSLLTYIQSEREALEQRYFRSG